MTIPPRFDTEFLEWFAATTEAGWAEFEPRTLDDYIAGGVGGLEWAGGTRWTGGLTDDEIAAIETEWGLRFPSDYRLFLQELHATDRPLVGALFSDDNTLEIAHGAGVYNWLQDEAYLREAQEAIVEGLVFDVEHNRLWPEPWGPRPTAPEQRALLVQAHVAAAPALAPIFGHRHLVLEPCLPDNPVLSIHQSDMIVYGEDLRTYLLVEFAGVGGWEVPPTRSPVRDPSAIPFWGEFLG